MTTMQDLSAAESADGAASKIVEKMEKSISDQIRIKTEELEQFIMANLSTGVTVCISLQG